MGIGGSYGLYGANRLYGFYVLTSDYINNSINGLGWLGLSSTFIVNATIIYHTTHRCQTPTPVYLHINIYTNNKREKHLKCSITSTSSKTLKQGILT